MRLILCSLLVGVALLHSLQASAQGTAVAERIAGASTASDGISRSSFEVVMLSPPRTGFFDTVTTEDTVRISASIFLASFNSSETVQIYVVIRYQGQLFYLQKGNVGGAWDGNAQSLPPYESRPFFSNRFNLTVYEGQLPPGEIEVFVAYARDGIIHFTSTPKRFVATGAQPDTDSGQGTQDSNSTADPDNPFALYTFDNSASDASGNNLDALGINGAGAAAGIRGGAIDLNGADQYVGLPDGILSDVEDFTISTFVKLDSVQTWSRILDFGNGVSSYMFLTPLSARSGAVSFAIKGSNTDEQLIHGTEPLLAGTWNHVAVTKAGTTATLYVNGKAVGSNTAMTLSPSSLGTTTQTWLGRSQFGGDPYLDGALDDFRIYRGALTARQIREIGGPDPSMISIMGSDEQITVEELESTLSAQFLTLVDEDELGINECTILYAAADREDISAEAGVLACNTLLANGDVELKTQAVYGGCDVARPDREGIGSRCQVGVASGNLRVKLSENPEIFNESELNLLQASECTALSTENTCFGASAEYASASYGFKNANGTGLGGGVSIGVGAGFDHSFEEGVLAGSVDLKAGLGFSIQYSVSVDDVKTTYKLGKSAWLENEGKLVAVGDKTLNTFEGVDDDVVELGDKIAVEIDVAGRSILATVNDIGSSVESVFREAENAFAAITDGANSFADDVGDGINAIGNGVSEAGGAIINFFGF